MKYVLSKIIKFYQIFISPHLGENCRFWPSCSEYSRQAIERYGILKGLWMSIRRISRCHPWSAGGIDVLKSKI